MSPGWLRGLWRRARRWVLVGATVAGVLLVAGSAAVWLLSRDLPDIAALRSYQPSLVTRVYADDNRQIGQFYVEKRVLTPLSKIPPRLIQAVIAVEDSRFYHHEGLDLIRIAKALLVDLASFEMREGASTITQQLARSLFLTQEKSLKRKVREILLALKIERLLSKDEILEMYLNQIYFGHGAYGVQAGAKTYFGKDVAELTLAEMAFIAGLPKAPSNYSPYFYPERAKARQGVVLRRMLDEKFVTDAEFRQAYQEDLYFARYQAPEEIAPYFLESLRQQLTATYGEEMVYKGGLNVYTTLNIDMQKAAVEAVREGLRAIDKRQGYRGPLGHVKLNEDSRVPKTSARPVSQIQLGEIVEGTVVKLSAQRATVAVAGASGILAIEDAAWARKRLLPPDFRTAEVRSAASLSHLFAVGDRILVRVIRREPDGKLALALEQEPVVEGALVAVDPRTGGIRAMVGGYDFKRSEFNRAVSARRQPGSAFKPIIYAAAIDRGLTPSTILVDSPVIFDDPVLQKIWKPTNYEDRFYGPITMREALAHSRNVATVKLLEQIGISTVTEFARRVGITSPLGNDLSLALGTSGVGLLELTSALAVFADEGRRVEPGGLRSVTDHGGAVLAHYEPNPTVVISRETAYVITNMLEEVIQSGTGTRARVLGRPLAGKTGTTNEFADAWFVGYAPNLAAGVWVGFDDRRSLGDREAGASVALPVWVTFMKEALSELPVQGFPIPEDVVFAKVDPKTGQLAAPGGASTVEIFVKPTVPTTVSRPTADIHRFHQLDRGA
ncbi:MAG: PBP1A family penicillin-binding protein [Nitrospirae bacterium]|nr:PBP1A family penicillin-binding protein [Nitrospirota bacterium]